jgi:hypothetical protein
MSSRGRGDDDPTKRTLAETPSSKHRSSGPPGVGPQRAARGATSGATLAETPLAKRGSTPDALGEDLDLVRATAARDLALRAIGEPREGALAPLIDPALVGGPTWPGERQSFRVVDRPTSTVLASDGLSSPDRAPDGLGKLGLGLEIVAETDDALPADLRGSWLFAMVYEIAQTAATHRGVRKLVDELGLVSVEVGGAAFPRALRAPSGRVGVLLGVGGPWIPERYASLGGQVRLVTATTLRPSELAHVLASGDAGRREVALRLHQSGSHHLCRLDRAAVV